MNEEKKEETLPTVEEASDESIPEAVEAEAEQAPADGDPVSEEIPVDYEAMAAEDLAEIKRLDSSYAPATHLGELPFARRFAELRDLGLSVKEALAAASPRFDRADGKRHLHAMTPRGTRVPEGTMDRDRMKEAKLLFGNLSESEINALYRRVTRSHND